MDLLDSERGLRSPGSPREAFFAFKNLGLWNRSEIAGSGVKKVKPHAISDQPSAISLKEKNLESAAIRNIEKLYPYKKHKVSKAER